MLPYDETRDLQCLMCSRRNNDTPDFLSDPDHAHSCLLSRGRAVKQRHDRIKMKLAALARECECIVEVEPTFPTSIPIQSALLQSESDSSSIDELQYEYSSQPQRPDLLLTCNGQLIAIDVSIVRPSQSSQLNRGQIQHQPLATTHKVEKIKHDLYDNKCAANQWKLVVFAVETYGALGC